MARTQGVKPKVDKVDIYVGRNLRLFRNLRAMSQAELATAVGISFQQVQKYERGVNRISASRIYSLSKALKVNVSDFFHGLEASNTNHDVLSQILHTLDQEGIELLKLYKKISYQEARTSLLNILKAYDRNDE
jgi:transcriptional regulator with XRE-family HTH domain